MACRRASLFSAVIAMPTTVPQPRSSTPVNSLDDVRTRQLQACLAGPSPSVETAAVPSSSIAGVVKDALQRHYGTLKGAALSMKPRMDPSQLSRELESGDFKLEKLDRLDDIGKAFVSKALHDAFGDPDPKAIARRLIREARTRLDELAEVVAL